MAVKPCNADSDTDYATLYRQSQEILREKDALTLRLRKELAEAQHRLLKQSKCIAKAVETFNVLISPEGKLPADSPRSELRGASGRIAQAE